MLSLLITLLSATGGHNPKQGAILRELLEVSGGWRGAWRPYSKCATSSL